MKPMRYLAALGVAASCLLPLLHSTSVTADDYPTKDIKLVMPFGPGGATDIIYRLASQEAEQYLGQSIVPINMPGAGASRGSREVKNARPDGYTMLGSHQTIQLAQLAGRTNYSYDAFEPVALLTQTVNIPTTYADHPVKKATDIAAYVNEHPGAVRIAMTPTSTSHFFWVQFCQAAGIPLDKVRLISYPDTGSQVSALLAKEVDFAMLNMPAGGAFYANGSFQPLGVAYDERLEALPEVPTLKEQGIDVVNSTDRGLFVPKGTPERYIQTLASAYDKALHDPDVAKRISEEFGSLVSYKSPEQYAQFLTESSATLDKVAENIDFSQ